MADITMCDDESCPRRSRCYSFTAPPNPYRQFYWARSPRAADGSCIRFISNAEREPARPQEAAHG